MVYKIITINSVDFMGTDFLRAASQLSELVNTEINQGWKPLGGVAIGETRTTHDPYLFQAMTKE